MRINRFIKNMVKDKVLTMRMKPIEQCRVMWTLVDGSELGIVVVVCEGDTDERIIERAWPQVRHGFHPTLRPKNKSDMRVVRRK